MHFFFGIIFSLKLTANMKFFSIAVFCLLFRTILPGNIRESCLVRKLFILLILIHGPFTLSLNCKHCRWSERVTMTIPLIVLRSTIPLASRPSMNAVGKCLCFRYSIKCLLFHVVIVFIALFQCGREQNNFEASRSTYRISKFSRGWNVRRFLW